MQRLVICGCCHLASMQGNRTSKYPCSKRRSTFVNFGIKAVDDANTLSYHNSSLFPHQTSSSYPLWSFEIWGLLLLNQNTQLDLKKNEQLNLTELSLVFLWRPRTASFGSHFRCHLTLLPHQSLCEVTRVYFCRSALDSFYHSISCSVSSCLFKGLYPSERPERSNNWFSPIRRMQRHRHIKKKGKR